MFQESFLLKKILIAGMYFDVGTRTFSASKAPHLPELKEVWGCAGVAAWALAEDFEIEISNLVFPNSRGEFKALKGKEELNK